MWRTACLLLGMVCTVFSTALAAAPRRSVRVVALPTTRVDSRTMSSLTARIQERLVARLDGRPATPLHPMDELIDLVARADTLTRQGAIDEAGSTLDVVLSAIEREPHRAPRLSLYGNAALTRASLAIASHDRPRAAQLIDNLIRYEPAFLLPRSAATPSMASLVEKTRSARGPHAKLDPELLGNTCHSADIVVIIRLVAATRVEFHRYDSCELRSRTTADLNGSPEAIIDALVPTIQTETAALPARQPTQDMSRPLYKRGWFWVAVGATVAASATGMWLLSSDDAAVSIEPHL